MTTSNTIVLYKGHTIQYADGYWSIATRPLLPFISLQTAKEYIDNQMLIK